jgi:gliding motility-associated-like protein
MNFTTVTLWDILFVRDADNCAPDYKGALPYPCNFNTCPPLEKWENAIYSGSYKPFSGSLESFNTGPVVGNWCLELVDKNLGNAGQILDFQVIFCDERGFSCCEAEAGSLASVRDVSACPGDSALLLKATPRYGALRPDSTYNYTYTLFRNDTLIQYSSSPDLRLMPAGNYTVCGLSFLQTDSSKLLPAGTALTPRGLFNNLTGPSPTLCADIDTSCVNVRINAIPLAASLVQTICGGDSLSVGDSVFWNGGNYVVRTRSAAGCDSIINVNLTVLPADTTLLDITLCNGEYYVHQADTFSTSGVYARRHINRFGCDSLIFIDVKVLPPIETNINDTICFGQSRTVGSSVYTLSGTYVDTLKSYFHCDSIVYLNLTVITVGVAIDTPAVLTCSTLQVPLNTKTGAPFGIDTYAWSSIDGTLLGPINAPTANAITPGTYRVTVSSLGCEATATQVVTQDIRTPIARALLQDPDTLTCAATSVTISGSLSSGIGPINYRWFQVSQGALPDTTVTISVNTPGAYGLIVRNLGNGCQDTALIAVVQDITPPQANAGPDGMLSCTSPGYLLDGRASLPPNRISFSWSSANGVIVGPTNIARPQADAPGAYLLQVTDIMNGCQDTDYVQVTVDTLTPVAVINFQGSSQLTCTNTTVILDGTSSNRNSNVIIKWNGPIDSGQGTLIAAATKPGTYELILNDSVNGCADTARHIIFYDTSPPIADAGPDFALSCTRVSNVVGGPLTSLGPEIDINWTADAPGLISGPANGRNLAIDKSGRYFLEVINQNTGCKSRDTVIVGEDPQPAIADAGIDKILNCRETVATLGGPLTSGGFSTYTWRNQAGQLFGQDKTLNIDKTGIYILTVDLAFCTVHDTVAVSSDFVTPLVLAGRDTFLHCTLGTANLNASNSDAGAKFAPQWTTSDGVLTSGRNSLTPVVGSIGTYILTILNTENHCSASDTVTVAIDSIGCRPSVNAGADGIINCQNANFQDTLEANSSTGVVFSQVWTELSGRVVNSTNPLRPIVTPGRFVLTVRNTLLGLSNSDTVEVVPDTVHPIADAGPAKLTFRCDVLNKCYQLNASGSSFGAGIEYQWESLNGSFCSATNIQSPSILGPGIYNLIVTNTANGCMADDVVLVELNDLVPLASAGNSAQIQCGDSTIVLNGGESSIGPDITYHWYSPGGSVISGSNKINPIVKANSSTDTFYLVVTNTVNSCQDTSSVVVFAPVNCSPACQATASGDISCRADTVFLSSSGSSLGPDISFQWTALSGQLGGNPDMAGNFTFVPGNYRLTVSRTYSNGARFSSQCQVQVADSRKIPIAEAGPAVNITCVTSSPKLQGSAAPAGEPYDYQWSTANGNIVSGQSSNQPTVNLPGTYRITVTNTLSGCTAEDFVTVGLDTIRPKAEAGPSGQLTCSIANLALQGTGTPSNLQFSWQTPNGNICAGADSPNPVACAAGTYYLTVTNAANGCSATDSTVISKSAEFPNVNPGPNLYFTCSDTVLTFTASASGIGSLSYQWTSNPLGCIVGPSNILQPTVACPGQYTLRVTDQSNGCSATSVVNVVRKNQKPTVSAGDPAEINCTTPVVTLNAGASKSNALIAGALDFSWSTTTGHFVSGQSGATPLVDSAGLYKVIVTDAANSCVDSAWVLVSIDADIPNAHAGTDTSLNCVLKTLQLDGSRSTQNSSGILYNWTTQNGSIVQGKNTLQPLIDKPGVYFLSVINSVNNCIRHDTVNIGIDTMPPDAEISPVTQVITCANPQILLSGVASSPQGNIQYAWTTLNGKIVFGENTALAGIDAGGTYSLKVSNLINGCQDSTKVVVLENKTPPRLVFAPSNPLTCQDTSISLMAAIPSVDTVYNFLWSGPGIISGINTNSPVVSVAGQYSVTLTNSVTGCQNTGSVLVVENKLKPTAIAKVSGALDCENLIVQLSGVGSTLNNVNYQWITSGQGSIGNPVSINTTTNGPGWHYLTVTRLDNGCMAKDSVLVFSKVVPITGAQFQIINPDCVNLEGSFRVASVVGGTPPFLYSINGGVFLSYPQFNFLKEGLYQLKILDINGCFWEDTVRLTPPGPLMVDLGEDIYIKIGQIVSLSAQVNISTSDIKSVKWTNLSDTASCMSCLTQTVAPLETTTYRINVTDNNQCQATDLITVWVDKSIPFYVPTAFSPDGNGINDRLMFHAGSFIKKVDLFSIYDRWGNLVFMAKDFPPNEPDFAWDGNFEGKAMNPAVFVWKVELTLPAGIKEVYYGESTLVRY